MIENRARYLCGRITPFHYCKRRDGPAIMHEGRVVSASYGLEGSSYDIRLAGPVTVVAGFMTKGLALEHIHMDNRTRGKVEDKSTNLRLGVRVSGRIEPGWAGHLTLEMNYDPPLADGFWPRLWQRLCRIVWAPSISLPAGWGIAAVEFEMVAEPFDYGVDPGAKYHNARGVEGPR